MPPADVVWAAIAESIAIAQPYDDDALTASASLCQTDEMHLCVAAQIIIIH